MEQTQQSWDFAQGSPDVALGRAIRTRREALGKTQSATAREMGALLGRSLHQSALTRAEQGERPLSAAELLAAAEVLGTDVSELVARAASNEGAVSSEDARSELETLYPRAARWYRAERVGYALMKMGESGLAPLELSIRSLESAAGTVGTWQAMKEAATSEPLTSDAVADVDRLMRGQ